MSQGAGYLSILWGIPMKLAKMLLALAVLGGVVGNSSATIFQYRVPLVPQPPFTLSPAMLPEGELNKPYNSGLGFDLKSLATQGNIFLDKSQITWSVVDGALPAGLAIDASGLLGGTPGAATPGVSFTVQAAYPNKQGRQSYLIKVGSALLRIRQISTGQLQTCAVTVSGGAKCWGPNSFGQLGSGTAGGGDPVDVVGLTSGVASISAGNNFACAVTTTGGAKCWGWNANGQLGDGSTTDRNTPVDVVGLTSGVASIVAGGAHTCALMTSGGVKCWGFGNYGANGNGSSATISTPANVIGLSSGVQKLSAGGGDTCALMSSGGGLKCWGYNAYGQLGDGSTVNRYSPVDVVGLGSGVAAVSVGGGHTCAMLTSGGAKCWGYDDSGQVGNGTTVNSSVPLDVPRLSSGVTSIATGNSFTCAVVSGGAKCWGTNFAGQLGNGTTTNSFGPSSVIGLASGIQTIGAGAYSGCVLTVFGEGKCWGRNTAGTLGDGTTTSSLVPVNVKQ